MDVVKILLRDVAFQVPIVHSSVDVFEKTRKGGIALVLCKTFVSSVALVIIFPIRRWTAVQQRPLSRTEATGAFKQGRGFASAVSSGYHLGKEWMNVISVRMNAMVETPDSGYDD